MSDIEKKYAAAKIDFEKAFKNFHEDVFLSKVLDKNKSTGGKQKEAEIVTRLVDAAYELEETNVGEGVQALIVILIREALLMRDRANELEYEMLLNKKKLNNLEKELGLETK